MAATELTLDLTNESFIRSVAEPFAIPAPVFYAGDSRTLRIELVERVTADEVEIITTAGLTIQVGIGTPAPSPTVIASATSSGAEGTGWFPVALDLSATAVQTALGTSSEIQATLEVRIIGATDPLRVSIPVKLRQRLLT